MAVPAMRDLDGNAIPYATRRAASGNYRGNNVTEILVHGAVVGWVWRDDTLTANMTGRIVTSYNRPTHPWRYEVPGHGPIGYARVQRDALASALTAIMGRLVTCG